MAGIKGLEAYQTDKPPQLGLLKIPTAQLDQLKSMGMEPPFKGYRFQEVGSLVTLFWVGDFNGRGEAGVLATSTTKDTGPTLESHWNFGAIDKTVLEEEDPALACLDAAEFPVMPRLSTPRLVIAISELARWVAPAHPEA